MDADENDDFEPLAISCTDTDCENDLHCFLQKSKHRDGRRRSGPCRECDADLVAWERVRARDIGDVDYTFESLRHELIRHEFFHRPFDQKAINHARRKGRRGMDTAAERRIRTSVGRKKHPREGRQTPYRDNVLHYAQHAVAACCRKCVEYWHGIEGGQELTEDQVRYLTSLVLCYVDLRLPDLAADPERVPPIRASKRPKARASTPLHRRGTGR